MVRVVNIERCAIELRAPSGQVCVNGRLNGGVVREIDSLRDCFVSILLETGYHSNVGFWCNAFGDGLVGVCFICIKVSVFNVGFSGSAYDLITVTVGEMQLNAR